MNKRVSSIKYAKYSIIRSVSSIPIISINLIGVILFIGMSVRIFVSKMDGILIIVAVALSMGAIVFRPNIRPMTGSRLNTRNRSLNIL